MRSNREHLYLAEVFVDVEDNTPCLAAVRQICGARTGKFFLFRRKLLGIRLERGNHGTERRREIGILKAPSDDIFGDDGPINNLVRRGVFIGRQASLFLPAASSIAA